MIKSFFCFLFIINIFLLTFTLSVSADQGADFCVFEELEFEEYLAIVSAISETEEYPHFFAENAERYKAYQERYPDMPFDVVIALVNVNNDMASYRDVEIVADPGEISVLLNKYFSLPPDWVPDEFTDIGNGSLMHPEAAKHYVEMRAAMREDNLNLVMISAYRDFTRQRNLFNNALATRSVARAERAFARVGHSEHHTGLAVDVMHRGHSGGTMTGMRFERSKQFSWLVENAHEYGFILRYPQGYLEIGGYIFEPWHWRFVGVPIATAMYDREIISYEEFYGRYLVQGMRDKVNEYIKEQQRLAEEAEAAAALEAAAAEAAELAASEAEEAELARVEAIIRAAAQAAAAEALANAKAELAELEAMINDADKFNIHFIVTITILGFSAVAAVLYVVNTRSKHKDGPNTEGIPYLSLFSLISLKKNDQKRNEDQSQGNDTCNENSVS